MLNEQIRTGLCVLVAIAWTVSVSVSMVNPDYRPDPSINGLFGLVVGAVLAVGKKDNSKDPSDDPDDAPRKGRR